MPRRDEPRATVAREVPREADEPSLRRLLARQFELFYSFAQTLDILVADGARASGEASATVR